MSEVNDNKGVCLSCGSDDVIDVLLIKNVPVHCSLLWDDREKAQGCTKGDIQMNFCNNCGHLYNQAFDDSLMNYTQEYDNTLDFSPVFQAYSSDLVKRLTESYQLNDKDIVEIGCGKGVFLKLISQFGHNRGYGFDKSYDPTIETESQKGNVEFIEDFYSAKYGDYPADLIISRHVLEHIRNPFDFMSEINSIGNNSNNTLYYIEVPNILYTLRDSGIWDLIYEHCSYFSPASLHHLFSRLGFGVLDVRESYGSQFLSIEANSSEVNGAGFTPETNVASVRALADKFGDYFNDKVSTWKSRLQELSQNGKKIVVWGGGSKGVSFLNFLETADTITEIVDINPRKQGKYVAGTGQKYVGPEDLKEIQPDVVIVMNPNYKEEITNTLHEMGLNPEMLTA